MKSSTSISFKRMFIIALIFSVLLTSINIPITVNAASGDSESTGTLTEGIDYSDPGSSGSKYDGKWLSTYAKGTGYKGEGILMYLLERNGGGKVANTVPVAF